MNVQSCFLSSVVVGALEDSVADAREGEAGPDAGFRDEQAAQKPEVYTF